MRNARGRPDPDELLARVTAEEARMARGRLTVFLGYAAGVGKTYSMLEAARERIEEGVDAVVAYVDTHGRRETEALLEGLEVLPRAELLYKGHVLEELDLDGLLRRRPELALIDELAHTNAPGSRHAKRFQDVAEALAAGINVYTTLNVQHLESLNDVVAQVTGITVRETIPDSVIDLASEIKVIDLPPDELLDRLRDGKVYIPEQAAGAMERFFRTGNLTALRELTLRRAATHVDDQMRSYMRLRSIPGPWPTAERLLVCVGPSPYSRRLIRAARRMADQLDAEWAAVLVETPALDRMNPEARQRALESLQLAEQLGAKTVRLAANSLADAVIDYARKHNVTKIIAGKTIRPRWQELFGPSIADVLIRASGPIDVFVISSESRERERAEYFAAPRTTHNTIRFVGNYAIAVLLVVLATILGEYLGRVASLTNVAMLYLAAVAIAGLYLGRGPAIVTSLLSVAAFDFFLVPPRLTLSVNDTEYVLTFLALLFVGLIVSSLAARAREQGRAAEQRALWTQALYDLSRQLGSAGDVGTVSHAVVDHLSRTLGARSAVLLPHDHQLSVVAGAPELALDEKEMAVASWVLKNGEVAGRGTPTLAGSGFLYLPLSTRRGVLGVLGVQLKDVSGGLQDRPLVEAAASQTAQALERAQLADEAGRLQAVQATERLQSALLNSISHDLRSPLVAISGALSGLLDDDVVLTDEDRRALLEDASSETDRLNRLVSNLLGASRLESGQLSTSCTEMDVEDLVGATIESLRGRGGEDRLVVTVPGDLPSLSVDPGLITQALANLIDNALKFSPPGSKVEVRAGAREHAVSIEVINESRVPTPESFEEAFEKFRRLPGTEHIPGSGLGLTICRGIADAHRGTVSLAGRPDGRVSATLTLPLPAFTQ